MIKKILLVVAILAAVCLMFAFILSVLFISGKPFPLTDNNFEVLALKAANLKLKGEFNSILRASNKTQKVSVTFSSDEISSYLYTYYASKNIISGGKAAGSGRLYLYFSISNSICHLKLSRQLSFWTPFGSYANITINFTPKIVGNRLQLSIYDLKIGAVSITNRSILNYIQEKITQNLNNSEMLFKMRDTMSGLKVNGRELLIVYSPWKAKQLFYTM